MELIQSTLRRVSTDYAATITSSALKKFMIISTIVFDITKTIVINRICFRYIVIYS